MFGWALPTENYIKGYRIVAFNDCADPTIFEFGEFGLFAVQRVSDGKVLAVSADLYPDDAWDHALCFLSSAAEKDWIDLPNAVAVGGAS